MKQKNLVIISFLFILLISLVFPQESVLGDTGDFYDKYEGRFDDSNLGEPYKKIIKAYDFETNTFDCGTFDFYCKMEGSLLGWSIGLVKSAIGMGDSAIVTAIDITDNSIFNKYKTGLSKLSVWMLSIFLMWQLVRITAMRFAEQDDGMIAINDQVIKVVTFSILLGVYEPLFNLIMNLQHYATEAVMDEFITLEDIVVTIFIYSSYYGFFVGILVAGIMLVFKIAFMYRFVLFGLLYITGVIAIPTGMNEEFNYFSLWLRLLIANGITLFLQAITFTLGINALFILDAFNRGTAFVTGMAFFILALTIPTLLGQLGSSSGTGRAMGGAVRAGSRMVGRRR